MILATLKYDFPSASYVAVLDDRPEVSGLGTTPEEAIEALRVQANKHALWPEEKL